MSAMEKKMLGAELTRPAVSYSRRIRRRRSNAAVFALACWASTWIAVVLLGVLLWSVTRDGIGWAMRRIDTHPYVTARLMGQDADFMRAAETALPGFTQAFAGGNYAYLSALAHDEDHPELFEQLSAAVGADLTGAGFMAQAQAQDPYFFSSFADDPRSYIEELRKDDPTALAALGIKADSGMRLAVLGKVLGDFGNSYPSRKPEQAGIKSAWMGSLWLIVLTALFAVPVGVAAAVYLEEYSRQTRFARFIDVNIANLAGVPSIVYGLLGLTLFVGVFSALKNAYPDSEVWAEPRNILAGALTMTLLVLPVIIIAAREAIKAVPGSLRQAAYALGATRWQVVSQHVLPSAAPGIVTGVILSLSRAIGETAPLITIGALTYVAFPPKTPLDGFTVLPIQVYNWISRPQEDFQYIAALGIIALLLILLAMNSIAIAIRNHYEGKVKW
jgi:phosphate transport system permease protein